MRPVDLFDGDRETRRWRILNGLEGVRYAVLALICAGVAVASFISLGHSLWDMVAPVGTKAPPTLSRIVASICVALLLAAGIDVVGIFVSKFPIRRARAREEWERWIADGEQRAAALKNPPPFPGPWPPVDARVLEDFLREIQIAEDGERLGRELRRFPDRTPKEGWPPPGLFNFGSLDTWLEVDGIRERERQRQYAAQAEYDAVRNWVETHLAHPEEISLREPDYTDLGTDERAEGYLRVLREQKTKALAIYEKEAQFEWVRRENAALKRPIALPQYWNLDSDMQLQILVERIVLQRWREGRSLWNGQAWVSDVEEARIARMIRAWASAFAQVVRHPCPMRALREIHAIVEQMELAQAVRQLRESQ